MHLTEALPAEALQAPTQLASLIADDMGTEIPLWPVAIPVLTEALREVENNRDRKEVVFAGKGDQGRPVLALDARRVDDGQTAGLHSLSGDEVEQLEGVFRRRLIVLVVGDKAAAEVRGDDLRRQEVCSGKRRLA